MYIYIYERYVFRARLYEEAKEYKLLSMDQRRNGYRGPSLLTFGKDQECLTNIFECLRVVCAVDETSIVLVECIWS